MLTGRKLNRMDIMRIATFQDCCMLVNILVTERLKIGREDCGSTM